MWFLCSSGGFNRLIVWWQRYFDNFQNTAPDNEIGFGRPGTIEGIVEGVQRYRQGFGEMTVLLAILIWVNYFEKANGIY